MITRKISNNVQLMRKLTKDDKESMRAILLPNGTIVVSSRQQNPIREMLKAAKGLNCEVPSNVVDGPVDGFKTMLFSSARSCIVAILVSEDNTKKGISCVRKDLRLAYGKWTNGSREATEFGLTLDSIPVETSLTSVDEEL